MKEILSLLFFALFLTNCSNNSSTDKDLQAALIHKIVNSESLNFAKNNKGQLIILNNKYCAELDCGDYFKTHSSEVVFYAKEDLFMRNIKQYIEILTIDEKQHLIKVKQVKGKEKMSVEYIQL